MSKTKKQFIDSFLEQNQEKGLRVFVAGGSRSGNEDIYVKEAYNLGQEIIKMGFKLDFGLSNKGIMGAVAKGVMDGWNQKQGGASPVQGITTEEYYKLYPQDDELLKKIGKVIVAKTLEERKQRLLEADFIVFAPGGVGTLDELAYDCVAMQDGFLRIKPFIIYNVHGYFHHLLEFLKEISLKGFADPVSFIVVEDSCELSIVFELLKIRYKQGNTTQEAYANVRQLIYELPYFFKIQKEQCIEVEEIIKDMSKISLHGSAKQRQDLADEIEQAYLEKEISRMHTRLDRTGNDVSIMNDKLANFKKRKKQ